VSSKERQEKKRFKGIRKPVYESFCFVCGLPVRSFDGEVHYNCRERVVERKVNAKKFRKKWREKNGL